MEIVKIIKDYWVLIAFLVSTFLMFVKFYLSMVEATKCSLRNDILDIYDRCKIDKKITRYELQAIEHSSEVYFKLKGNSFVKDVVERVKDFELID